MPRRGEVLEMAILGLLRERPMHGYELRKHLNAVLGWGHALSYGSLYPCLKTLRARGDLVEDGETARAFTGRRARIVYRLTEAGERRFADLLADGGPSTWEDERFGVHFAFFGRTDVEVRLRILEGRRRRLEERLERVQDALQRTQERLDYYTLELHRHDLESVEHEVRWLDSLISTERDASRSSGRAEGRPTGRNPPHDTASATTPDDEPG